MNTKQKMLLSALGSAVITVLYFIYAYNAVPFVYDIVDDIMMRDVASGVTTGVPDGHLIYIKYILGLFASILYKTLPGYDWYGILLLGIFCLSLFVLLYRGYVIERSVLFKIVYTFFVLIGFTCIGLRQLSNFQFTVVAGMAGGAGIFLFLTANSNDIFQRKIEEYIAVICMLLSFCVRDTVFLLMLPAAAFVFWYKYGYVTVSRIPFRLHNWKLPLVLLSCCIILLGIELTAYSSKEWRTYLQYNKNQVDVMDYYGVPEYENNVDFYNGIQISPEAAVNIGRYSLHLAPEVYPNLMKDISVKSKELYFDEYHLLERFGVGLAKIYRSMHKKEVLLTALSVVLVFAYLLIESRKNRKKQILLGTLTLTFLACWLYLAYKARIVDRVIFTLLFIQLFTYLGLLGIYEQIRPKHPSSIRISNIIVLVCTFLLMLQIGNMELKTLKENNMQRSMFIQQYNHLKSDLNKDNNIYIFTTFTVDIFSDIFTVRRDFEFTNTIELGTWASFSVWDTQKQSVLGVSENSLEKTILENENCYVVSSVSTNYMDRYFTAKYGERYAGRVLIDTKNYGDKNFEIFKFSLAK